ncbi:TPA: hypothetical protein ACGRG7_002782 [Morganella morganii]
MMMKIKINLLLPLCLFLSAPALAVDCNDTEVRRELISLYNDVLDVNDAGVKVLDAYNQVTEKYDGNGYQCVGLYDFSDGDTLKVRYKEYTNSLGDPLYSFEPVDE